MQKTYVYFYVMYAKDVRVFLRHNAKDVVSVYIMYVKDVHVTAGSLRGDPLMAL